MSLNIINDNLQLNIDSYYSNLALYAKVNSSAMTKASTPYIRPTTNLRASTHDIRASPNSPASVYRYTIPANIDNPIAAMSISKNTNFAGGIKAGTGGTKVLEVYTDEPNFIVYIFSSTKVNNKNYGLEVYSPSRELLFDSENKYLKFLPAIDNSKTCALLLHGAVQADESPLKSRSYIFFLWAYTVLTNNTIKEVKWYYDHYDGRYNQNNAAYPKPNYDGTPLVIDVTGY